MRFEQAYGATRADDLARPVFVDTRFDLASLTKLFVSTLALRAVEEGLLELDEPLARLLPAWRDTDHEPISLRMLLAHNSGMNSGADYRQLLGHDVVRYTLERELVGRPGERVIYSDLGFIAIGELLQRMYQRSLSDLMTSLRSSPFYRPAAPGRLADSGNRRRRLARTRARIRAR